MADTTRLRILGAAVIALTTAAAYLPAIGGGFIWDDPEHVVNNHTLRGLDGLARMWTVPRSLPQWYPLTHSSFWIEYQLWGAWPTGYHLNNVLLHIVSSLLFWRLLRMLQVPGAWLAAAIFALHPVQVESVAWITERKNVLSALFYFLTILSYLRFVQAGEKHSALFHYAVSLALFIAALLSKTVTATLPAAILVILWWKRGSIRGRDVLPLGPFFVLGISLGLFTAWLETHHVGATGERVAELDLSALDRVLVAGRAVWFYAAKLVWPWPLAFIYPRWQVEWRIWWQWIFPIALPAMVILLALYRRRTGRGPLAATLLFVGTLFPALGFVNVYPMRFSFVADHFQYLASAWMIALLAAIAWRFMRAASIILLVPLVALTALRTPVYRNAETLWRDTLAKNPDSWMVHTNLAHVLRDRAAANNDEKLFAEAEQHYLRALELAPNIHDTHVNVGLMLGRRGYFEQAMQHFQKALEINPDFAPAYYGIGQVCQQRGDVEKAEENYRRALRLAPQYPQANFRLAALLERQGRFVEAVEHYRTTVGSEPDNAEARYNLANCLIRLRLYDEAIYNLLETVRLRPDWAEAWTNLGAAQLMSGRRREAVQSFQRALAIQPDLLPAQRGLQQDAQP